MTLTLGVLVAFLQYSARFYRPISDMSEKFNVLQSAMASSERIFTLLDTPVSVVSPAQPVTPAAPLTGHIVFDRVWFAYNNEDWVLKDVSFEVRPGERVALVGATGSGKTTIISLLLRFYDVQRGQIRIDGVDVRDLDLDSCAACLPWSCRTCICSRARSAATSAWATKPSTMTTVRNAATAVRADRFITALPAGFDAPVAERGATLSTGEKQLLSFARALAFDRPVLILDEATSSVDTETEHTIQQALHVLMEGPNDHCDRSPPFDDPGHGYDPRAPQGRPQGIRHPPGPSGPARHLLPAVSAAVCKGGVRRMRAWAHGISYASDRMHPRTLPMRPCPRAPMRLSCMLIPPILRPPEVSEWIYTSLRSRSGLTMARSSG